MDVKIATDVGRVRENNEDSLWVGAQCLVVCDGMGGHRAGEIASGLAIQTIRDFSFSGREPLKEVPLAIEQAQTRILQAAQNNEEYQGMGTTITLAWLTPLPKGGAELIIGHVGDSRGYMFLDDELVQLTSDHSVVGELLRMGTITPLEARTHTKRHTLTQALGSKEIEIELVTKSLAPGSLVMLCSDGLTDVADDAQIAKLLEQTPWSSNVAQKLVDLANELGGPDNITVIVARV